MRDQTLKKELETITTDEAAERSVLHLLWRLNQVAKTAEAEETLKREVYALKRRAIHYFDLKGCIASRTAEANGLSYIVIEAHGERIGMHLNTKRSLKNLHRREYMIKERDDLSEQIDTWFRDRHEMLFALKKIALALGFSKPRI